jgi:hypothetical protein
MLKGVKSAFIQRGFLNSCLCFVLLFSSFLVNAQQESEQLNSTRYYAGYNDTVIFKSDVTYKGKKLPFIVGVWFPVTKVDSAQCLSIADFFEPFHSDSILSPGVNLMEQNLLKIVSGYFMESDFFIDYKDPSKKKLAAAQKIFQLKTNSFRSKFPDGNKFPCLVYHHGSGSNPFENNELFELMAQNGYIVVSASYMLADSTNQKLISNHTAEKSYAGDIEFITGFVKSLACVDTSKMVLIGHSWGAQASMQYDYYSTQKSYRALISLQTTLEEVSVEEAAHWKYLDFIYNNACENCTTPAYLFTSVSLRKRKSENTKEFEYRNVQPEYLPFKENKTTAYSFITLNKILYHHQFVSAGHLRYHIASENEYKDIRELKEQYLYYLKLNETILFLCDRILQGKGVEVATFCKEQNYSLEELNK